LIHFFTKTVKQSNLLYTIKLAKSGTKPKTMDLPCPAADNHLPDKRFWKT
jgi:hypothetical protein